MLLVSYSPLKLSRSRLSVYLSRDHYRENPEEEEFGEGLIKNERKIARSKRNSNHVLGQQQPHHHHNPQQQQQQPQPADQPSGPVVEFFNPKLRHELEKKDVDYMKRTGAKGAAPGGEAWVWLTSYSRIPVSVLWIGMVRICWQNVVWIFVACANRIHTTYLQFPNTPQVEIRVNNAVIGRKALQFARACYIHFRSTHSELSDAIRKGGAHPDLFTHKYDGERAHVASLVGGNSPEAFSRRKQQPSSGWTKHELNPSPIVSSSYPAMRGHRSLCLA